jgi:hypothetical protein
VVVPISFTVPLATVPQAKVEPEAYNGSNPECPSTTEELEEGTVAKAAPGFLCVYPFFVPETGGEHELKPLAQTVNGTVLLAKFIESLAGEATWGVWAVTAE